jgi:Tfp pilus assembly protein PilZ
MSTQEQTQKEKNATLTKLFQIAIELNEDQQKELLAHAEQLLIEDKRENIRQSCNIPVSYAANDRVYSNQITNISANGLFIETRRSLLRGDEVIMAFKLEGFDKSLRLKGEVARANQAGVGVAYKNVSPHIEEMIRVIVNRMKSS